MIFAIKKYRPAAPTEKMGKMIISPPSGAIAMIYHAA